MLAALSSGWFWVVVVVPIVAPLVTVAVMLVLRQTSDATIIAALKATVIDGQLAWLALSFAAATLYELRVAETSKRLPLRVTAAFDWASGLTIVVLSLSLLAIGSGGIALAERTNDRTALRRSAPGVKTQSLFLVSVVLLVASVALYTVAHFFLRT